MKKNGKSLERLVTLIQQALSDKDNTQVFSNYKIKDSTGGKREIDVLIKSELNGFEILVAIECKDYSRPVSIDKIDSFKAKCDSISKISKKVFVSTNGYSSGAKRNANEYGILLYDVKEISFESINEWFPKISQLHLQLQIVDFKFGLGTTKENILKRDSIMKPHLYRNGLIIHEHIFILIQDEVKAYNHIFWNKAIMEFMRNSEIMLNEGIIQTCTINFPNGFSLLEISTNEHISLQQLIIDVKTSLLEKSPEILNLNSYGEQGQDTTIHQLSVDMGNETIAEIVHIGNKKYELFIKNETGDLTQLSTLGIYDPKKDNWTDLLK